MYNFCLKKLPKVSIIIPNYNGRSFLDACLSSISQINYPRDRYDVILVDNGSNDGSVEYVRNRFPWVIILVLNRNYGFTGGNNRGAKIARGDLIVFLNNDTVVDKNWLYELVKVTLSDKLIGICGSKIMSMKDRNVTQYNGRHLHVLGGVIPSAFYTYKNELGKEFHAVGSVQGSSFLVRKDVFKSLGGFDRDYFLYSDEVDICYRAWISGYYVAYAPNSIVYHYGGGTARTLNSNRSGILYERLKSSLHIYYGTRNSIINVLKNLELRNMLLGIVFSFFLLLFQLLVLLKDGDIKDARLLISASMWPIKNLKNVWKKRLNIQARRKLSDQKLLEWKLLISITDTLRLILC